MAAAPDCATIEAFPVPPVLPDIALRRQSDADAAMQESLFVSVRAAEFEALGWPEEAKRALLAQQSQLQQTFYAGHYPNAEFYTVLSHGEPIGRFYIDRSAGKEVRLIDIAFFEAHRGGGIGTALLKALLADARAAGKYVGLHVEAHNPAKRLYERLGFVEVEERPPYVFMTCG